MGAAEGHALLDQPLGHVGGQGESLGGELGHALVVQGHGGGHPGHGGQEDRQGVDGVEDRLLVLLQVTGVGQGQALEGGQQPGQVADEPPGLAPGQFRHVRVLLLGHDRGAGGVGVVQGGEAELLGGPDDDLLAQAGEVHGGHGQDEGQLGDDVARAGAVDGVLHRRREAQVGGHRVGIQAERAARQGARAVGGHRGARVPVLQALHVAHERPGVGQQVVGHQDRLGVLEVGAPGHDALPGPRGLVDEGVDDVEHETGQVTGLVAQVHADESGDLVVAGAARAQAPAQVLPRTLHEPALQGGVDVLVTGCGGEGTRDDVVLQLVQGGQHALQLAVVQQGRGVQGPGVGPRPGDVVAGKTPVETGGRAQGCQSLGGPAAEAPAPQADPLRAGGVRGGRGQMGGGRWRGAGAARHDSIMAHPHRPGPQPGDPGMPRRPGGC